jgi:hypothetical protein
VTSTNSGYRSCPSFLIISLSASFAVFSAIVALLVDCIANCGGRERMHHIRERQRTRPVDSLPVESGESGD